MTPTITPEAARLARYLSKMPTLDPSWSPEIQVGWMRCFNALAALAKQDAAPTSASTVPAINELTMRLENIRAEAILAMQAARKAALEEAAKVCEDMHEEDRPSDYAYAIRSLADRSPT